MWLHRHDSVVQSWRKWKETGCNYCYHTRQPSSVWEHFLNVPCIYEHILIKHSRVESFTLHYVSHPNSCDTKSRGTITIIGDGEAFRADRFFVQTIKACHLFNCFFSGCRYPFLRNRSYYHHQQDWQRRTRFLYTKSNGYFWYTLN